MLLNSNPNLRNMASQAASSTIQFTDSAIQASNLTPIKQTVTVLPITNTGAYHYSTSTRQSTSEQQQQGEHPTNPIQVKNYINWVNTHLKKRPGVKLIENLQTDMRDGVALIHLIEVISGHVLANVNLNPKTHADYKDNIEKILRFMQENSIKMHQTTSKDIVDGVLKPTMRLILSLAAHFKPTNVQHYSAAQAHLDGHGKPLGSTSPYISGSKSVNRISSKDENGSANVSSESGHELQVNAAAAAIQRRSINRAHDSMTHLVQAACVNLADARRYNNQQSQNFNVKYVKRNNLPNSASSSENSQSSGNQVYPAIKLEHASPLRGSDSSKMGDFKSPGANISNSAAHPLASSTVISSQPATPTSGTTLPIEHANVKIEVKQAASEPSQPLSKENASPATVKTEAVVSDQAQSAKIRQDSNELLAMFGNLDEDLSVDIKGLKNDLLKLQSLLMNCTNQEFTKILEDAQNEKIDEADVKHNQSSSSKECSSTIIEQNSTSSLEMGSGLTPAEQIAILQSRIQQLEILSSDLRNELNHAKSETMHSAGVHSGLKSRVNEQDNTILEMKKEQLNLHLVNQQLEKEKEELARKLDDRTMLINRLKSELNIRNEQIEKMRSNISSLNREKEEQAKYVKQQDRVVKTVTSVIEKVQEKESVLVERLENTNRKLGMIETCHKDGNGKVTNTQMVRQQSNQIQMLQAPAIISAEEANFLRESLLKLRQNIHSSHPSQLIINTLEQGFTTILERSNQLNSASSSYASSSSSCTSSSANSPVMSVMPTLTTIQFGGNHSAPSSSSSSTSSAYSSSSLITVQRQSLHGVYRGDEEAGKHHGEDKLDNSGENHNDQFTSSEGNVKKLISRFISNTGNPTNVPPTSTTPATLNMKARNEPQKPPSNSLLTISSSNSSAASPSPPSLSSYSSTSMATAMTSTSLKQPGQVAQAPPVSSKIIYYLDKSPTPYMTTLAKPLNSITLRDFKELLKLKPAQHLRFYFKSQDPEFGVVREEISNDNGVLPSFEGRIVSWISENDSTEYK